MTVQEMRKLFFEEVPYLTCQGCNPTKRNVSILQVLFRVNTYQVYCIDSD